MSLTKFKDLEPGTKVKDTWFSDRPYDQWGTGLVTTKLKTVVYVDFVFAGTVKYDRAHACRFLERLV